MNEGTKPAPGRRIHLDRVPLQTGGRREGGREGGEALVNGAADEGREDAEAEKMFAQASVCRRMKSLMSLIFRSVLLSASSHQDAPQDLQEGCKDATFSCNLTHHQLNLVSHIVK